ncbi:MAG: ribosome biogenesis GTPase YlqF [Saccharofermentans sp.]|nr:ribosome biogenesis GTPase YlqF [Saccharofermentans sp.]
MAQDINWFPGHMRRTLNETKDALKLVDLVYETCDARIPFSSRNPELDKLIGTKPRVVILNKADLADPNKTNEWIQRINSTGSRAVCMEATKKKGLDKLEEVTMELMKDILDRAAAKGREGRPVRAMVVGVPNTGKSTLINALAGKKAAVTGDKPGVTRQAKWIRTSGRLELMDMPGVLWPKIASQRSQLVLTATGAIKMEVTDNIEVSYNAINLLYELYPELMEERYKVKESFGNGDLYERFLQMGKLRGCLMSGGRVDEERFARSFLDDLRSGRIGRISLEIPYGKAD